LFILEYFKICFYFHGHQKGTQLWQRGATEVWGGAVAPNCPPGSATAIHEYCIINTLDLTKLRIKFAFHYY